jgi:hypothetical protein
VKDIFHNQYPVNSSIPILVLNGDLDPATPHYWAVQGVKQLIENNNNVSVGKVCRKALLKN